MNPHDLREAFSGGPVVVHPGETQVLERLGLEAFHQAGVDFFDWHLSPPQAAEQVVEFVGIDHRAPGV